MPEKRSESSLMMQVMLIAVFLALAIIGSLVIFYMSRIIPPDVNVPRSYGSGLNVYIDGVPHENMSRFLYARNGSFSGTLRYFADSDVPVDGSCLMLALLDYNQTSLYYNGSGGIGQLIEFRTPFSGNVTFGMTGLREGLHDILFLTIRDPYVDFVDDPGFGSPWTDGTCTRFKVIEGNATVPEIRYGAGPLEKYISYRNNQLDNVMGYGPWLTEIPCADMLLPDGRPSGNAIDSMTASPGQELDYYINVKNGVGDTNERYGRFALLQFLDDEKVPLRLDLPEDVYYGTLDPDRFLALHASIKAPVTPGTHMLSLVLAGYPYENNGEDNVYASAGIVTVTLNVKV